MKGQKGDRGRRGDQGERGPRGPNGNTGPLGPQVSEHCLVQCVHVPPLYLRITKDIYNSRVTLVIQGCKAPRE